MGADDGDDLVVFQDVRVIGSAGPALCCRILGRDVWLPRRHISGKLWCIGDRGKLFVRRWVARDRRLIDDLAPSGARPQSRLPVRLRLLGGGRREPDGK